VAVVMIAAPLPPPGHCPPEEVAGQWGRSDGGADWSGLFVGVPGERTFDRTLIWKYLRPNQTNQVILEAVDRFSQPLRGYQSVFNLNVGAGQDSTLVSPMTRCGYEPTVDDCIP
jgi:hypothetical protein